MLCSIRESQYGGRVVHGVRRAVQNESNVASYRRGVLKTVRAATTDRGVESWSGTRGGPSYGQQCSCRPGDVWTRACRLHTLHRMAAALQWCGVERY